MELVHGEITPGNAGKPRVELRVDRLTLAKRRWRSSAADGREFGFDLEQPIGDGVLFFESDSAVYAIAQQAEDLYEIAPGDAAHAARIGWMIGNLHFPIAIEEGSLLAPADPAVLQLLEREHVRFTPMRKVFHPVKTAGGHRHHHEH